MRNYLFLVLSVLFSNYSFSSKIKSSRVKPVSIEEAMNSGALKAVFKANGKGYNGRCISLKMESLSNDSLFVKLEAGRRLDSNDDTQQDILVCSEELFVFSAKQKREFAVFGFCCQATNRCPQKDSLYKVGQMADSLLVQLAKYVNKKKYAISGIQHAVWCLSNNHLPSTIDNSETELKNYVCKLKGIVVPWYTTTYLKATNGNVFSDKPNVVSGKFEFSTKNEGGVVIIITDIKGRQMNKISRRGIYKRGTYDYDFELSVINYPKGKYFIQVFCESQVVAKKEFDL